MEELTKEEWRKILTESNIQYRDAMMEAAINKSVADTARENLKNFDEGKDKKLGNAPSEAEVPSTGRINVLGA